MLKRVITAAVGVVGLVLVALGVASATIWRADDVLVATAATGAHTYVTDPGVLELGGSPATVHVTAPGKAHVVLAVGRDTDVTGWIGSDAHARITGLSGWHALAVEPVAAKPAPTASASPGATAAPAPAEPSPSPTSGAANTATADPTGSDLWVVQSTGEGSATLEWPAQPGRWSLVAVSTGDAAPTLSISWPRVVTTPWLWPLVVVGTILFLAALFAFLWQERRRHRGDEASWVPVETGATPVVDAGAQPAVPLTRRQLREAALARTAPPASGAATPDHAAVSSDAPSSPARPGSARPDVPPAAAPWTPAAPRTAPDNPAVRPSSNDPAGRPAPEQPATAGSAPRAALDAPASATTEPAPVTAPTSRRALRAAGVLTGATPTVDPVAAAGPPSSVVSSSADTAVAASPSAPHGRPAWVPSPTPPTPTSPTVPSGRPGEPGEPEPIPGTSHAAHPRWLGADATAPTAAVPAPTAPPQPGTSPDAESTAQPEPAAAGPSFVLPPPGPQRTPTDEPAADDETVAAGSRADAWRRAWGLPPLDLDDEAPRGDGRHGR